MANGWTWFKIQPEWMVQLNEWTGGTMCKATMQMWALQEESWGMHTAHMGKCHRIPEPNAVCLFEEMQGQLLYFWSQGKVLYAARTWGKKHQEGKWIPFLVLLWILGGEEMGPLQRPEHFSCRGLDSPLTHSEVIMDPVTYNQKKLRNKTLSSPSPPPLISFPTI